MSQSAIPPAPFRTPIGVIQVRKARWGWYVDGYWCPTISLRGRKIRQIRERTGKTHVRTPG